MALFGKKKKDTKDEKASDKKELKEVVSEKEKTQEERASKLADQNVLDSDLENLLIKPRITEKATILASDQNAYVFNIRKDATKPSIKKAIQKIYKVTPEKIAIVNVPSKKVQVRGKRGKFGTKSGGKKAYVFLKEGDRIEFV